MPFTLSSTTTLALTVLEGGMYSFSLTAMNVNTATNIRWLITPSGDLPVLSGFEGLTGTSSVASGASGELSFNFTVPVFRSLATPGATPDMDTFADIDPRSGARTFKLEIFEDADDDIDTANTFIGEEIITISEAELDPFSYDGGKLSFDSFNSNTLTVGAITNFNSRSTSTQTASNAAIAAHSESLTTAGVYDVVVFYDTTDSDWELDIVDTGTGSSLNSVHVIAKVTITDGTPRDSAAFEFTLPDFGDDRPVGGTTGVGVRPIADSGPASYDSAGASDLYVVTRYMQGDVVIEDDSGVDRIRFDFGVEITNYDDSGTHLIIDFASGGRLTVENFGSTSNAFTYQIGNGRERSFENFKKLIGTVTAADPYVVQLNANLRPSEEAEVVTAIPSTPVTREYFGSRNNDVVAVGGEERQLIDAGAGDDIYIITPYHYGEAVISDGRGLNLIKLGAGTTYTHFIEDATVMTMLGITVVHSVTLRLEGPSGLTGDDAPSVMITNPATDARFRYQIGDGDVMTYAEFKREFDSFGGAGNIPTGPMADGDLVRDFVVDLPQIGLPETTPGEYIRFDNDPNGDDSGNGAGWFLYDDTGGIGPAAGVDTKKMDTALRVFPNSSDSVYIDGEINDDTNAAAVDGQDVYILDVDTFGNGQTGHTMTGGTITYTETNSEDIGIIEIGAITAFTPNGASGPITLQSGGTASYTSDTTQNSPVTGTGLTLVHGQNYLAILHQVGGVWTTQVVSASDNLSSYTNLHVLAEILIGADDKNGDDTIETPVVITPEHTRSGGNDFLEVVRIHDPDGGFLHIRDTANSGNQVVGLRSVIPSGGARSQIEIDIGNDDGFVLGRVEFSRIDGQGIDLIAFDSGDGLQGYDPRDDRSMVDLGEALGLDEDILLQVFPEA